MSTSTVSVAAVKVETMSASSARRRDVAILHGLNVEHTSCHRDPSRESTQRCRLTSLSMTILVMMDGLRQRARPFPKSSVTT